jgi:hypothetical protein
VAALAAYAKAAGDEEARDQALELFRLVVRHLTRPGLIPAKTDPGTRPMKSLAGPMIGIVTAQILRRATDDPMLRTELQRALTAAQDQAAGIERLTALHSTLLSRMQTAVYELEALATRLGEVVALGTESVSSDRAAGMLASADEDLESLRAGLAEAHRLAREAPDLP